jgi:hypothetical protein
MEKNIYIDKVSEEGASIMKLPAAKLWMVQAMDKEIAGTDAECKRLVELHVKTRVSIWTEKRLTQLLALRLRRDLLLYGFSMNPHPDTVVVEGGGGEYKPGQAAEETFEMTAKLALGQVRRKEFDDEDPKRWAEHYTDMVREIAIWLSQNGYIPADMKGKPVPSGELAAFRDWSVGVLKERSAVKKALLTPILGREKACAPDYIGDIFFMWGRKEYRGLTYAEGIRNIATMDEIGRRLHEKYDVPIVRDSGGGIHIFYDNTRPARPLDSGEVQKAELIERDTDLVRADTAQKMLELLWRDQIRLAGEIDKSIIELEEVSEGGPWSLSVKVIRENHEKYKESLRDSPLNKS